MTLLGGAVLQLALQYRLNYWSRDFFDAFGRRDGSALWTQALLFLLLAGLSILTAVLSIWARMMTQIQWRAWLTRHLIDRWLANERFLQLHFLRGEDRNPEYRIAEDVRVATDAPVSMAAGLLTALLNVTIFVGILWNVGGDLVVQVLGTSRPAVACRARSRFCCVNDPCWLDAVTARPDRAHAGRLGGASPGASCQCTASVGQWHELRSGSEGVVPGRRHDPDMASAVSRRWDRGPGEFRLRRGCLPSDGGAAGTAEGVDRRDVATDHP